MDTPPGRRSQNARDAVTLIQKLRKDSFGVQSAKTAATKVLWANDAPLFTGSEDAASDIFAQLVGELAQLSSLQSPAFTRLFDLSDVVVEVLSAANELLFSVLLLLTAPGFPARNWVEASGSDAPADGKRATLEVAFLPEDAVKRRFLAAMSGDAYGSLIDSFARADQRAAVF
ncbi:hypothetical protein CYMTET_37119 [Cymbomonas tetramitiformis]|uniref:Uncharacterized protein n=1 Tax=Cymbomonas tetramitiformis TaxID=36881 RepID=A0AAE0CEJ2_9CHLO|nr:hypothetical protein CYMTET_37119 [Cymbomonas tetramitiformis]